MAHPILGILFIIGMIFLALMVVSNYCKVDEPKRKMTPEEEKKYEIDG